MLTGVVKVKEILDIPVYESHNAFPADHSIDLRDVSFSYDGKATVLEHCNLHIDDGEKNWTGWLFRRREKHYH